MCCHKATNRSNRIECRVENLGPMARWTNNIIRVLKHVAEEKQQEGEVYTPVTFISVTHSCPQNSTACLKGHIQLKRYISKPLEWWSADGAGNGVGLGEQKV